MRNILLAMILLISIPSVGQSQWQHIISLDSRVGYSTNSYLNPFLSEWNTNTESTYNLTTAVGQSYWYKNNSSLSLTGGLFLEPIFEQQNSWKGGLGLVNYNYRFADDWSIGGNAGASYLTDSYSRSVVWIQPKITWFISPFTLTRVKAGSMFRNYQDYADEESGLFRYDMYGVEFETWPSYRWQIKASLYGSLDALPRIQEGFNTTIGAEYHFWNGASVGFDLGLDQYQTEIVQDGGGGPPVGLPPDRQETSTNMNTDRLYRLKAEGSYPINNRFSIFAATKISNFKSESADTKISDYEMSAGVRFSFEPKFRKDRRTITPDWEMNREKQELEINYSGEGRLYLVGDFNNWSKAENPLRKQSGNSYVAELNLPPGAYEYKILLIQGASEEWLSFSSDTYTVDDGFGSENAMILVE